MGSTYLLTYNPTPVFDNGKVKTYEVTLTVDTSAYSGKPTDWLGDVAIKIASKVEPVGTELYQSSLVSNPPGTWNAFAAGLNANGCHGGRRSGFLCAENGASAVVGDVYSWTFLYATTKSLMSGPLAGSVKAGYFNYNKKDKIKNRGITSEGITLQTVPDGGMTLMLLGGVLLGLETLRRKYRV